VASPIGKRPSPSLTPTNTSTATASFTPTPTQILPIFSNAVFTYDGDGKRVKSVITTDVGTMTTYFVGTYYEVPDGVVANKLFTGQRDMAGLGIHHYNARFYSPSFHQSKSALYTRLVIVAASFRGLQPFRLRNLFHRVEFRICRNDGSTFLNTDHNDKGVGIGNGVIRFDMCHGKYGLLI
jgi:hypothetical protein